MNLGLLAVIVSLTLRVLAWNVGRKLLLFASPSLTVCRLLQLHLPTSFIHREPSAMLYYVVMSELRETP